MKFKMKIDQKLITPIKHSFLFLSLFYFLDSLPLLYTFANSTAFSNIIAESLLTHTSVLSAFLFGIISLLIVLSLLLGIVLYIFKVRNRYIFFLLIFIYSYTYNLVEQPSIFDDFIYGNYFIQILNGWLDYYWVYAIVLMIFSVLNYSFFCDDQRKRKDLLLALSTNLVLAYFFFEAQKPFHSSQYKSNIVNFTSNQKVKGPLNIVIIGIDSLREDSITNLHKNSLASILNNSTTFRSSVSPVANTRPAYNSILSGKIPPDIKQRFPLKIKDANRDVDLKDSPLIQFKNSGYSIHYMLDDASYNNPEKGTLFQSVDSPPNTSDMRKYIYPIILRSRLLFTFFNNELGNLIFPGIYANFAYTYSYKVSGFKDKVNHKVSKLKEDSSPFLLIVHTSALHFPGNFRYPYYVKGGPQSSKLLGFGSRAPYLNAISESLPAPSSPTADFYPRLYQKGVAMVTNHFINPILDHLNSEKMLNNTIVVLFSDHGETFWDQHEIPRLKLPNHGTFLLGEDHSPKTFLSIYTPNKPPAKIEKDFPLVTLLPYLCNLSNSGCSLNSSALNNNPIYTETGMFPLKLFTDQFFFSNFRFSELFSIDKDGKVFLSEKAIKPILIQKSRAVYSHPYRLTLYLANDGYRLFLCNYSNDEICLKNLVYSEPIALDRLFKKLMLQVEQDVVNGYIPKLKINYNDPLYATMPPETDDDHLTLLYAVTTINRNLDLSETIKKLDLLVKKAAAPKYIRLKARNALRQICETEILKLSILRAEPPFNATTSNYQKLKICQTTPSIPIVEKSNRRKINPFKKNDLLLQKFKESGDQNVYANLQNSNLTTEQQKLFETLVFFKDLSPLQGSPEVAIEKISIFLNKNYRLATSLELREEFDLFWSEAFDFMENKFGEEGVYHLILYQVFYFRISTNYFLDRLLPLIIKNNILSDGFYRDVDFKDSDLKKSIAAYMAFHYFCKTNYNNRLCLRLRNKLSMSNN